MRFRSRTPGFMTTAVLALLLAGCATYYPASDRGVHLERPAYRGAAVAYVDPLVYPYWSLDYFYYSRFYHPYSVVVHRWDPWYYPYPGWYYGYWPGPRFAGYGGHRYYPWYRHANRYAGYRPWQAGIHLSFGRHDRRDAYYNRVRELDARLGALETRRSQLVRAQRPDRGLMPAPSPWLPATGRGASAASDRTAVSRSGAGLGDARAGFRRQALIERLRATERSGRSFDLPARSRDRTMTPPETRIRTSPPPQRRTDPTPPVRQRSAPPSPPRSRPQPRQERDAGRSSRRTRPPQPH